MRRPPSGLALTFAALVLAVVLIVAAAVARGQRQHPDAVAERLADQVATVSTFAELELLWTQSLTGVSSAVGRIDELLSSAGDEPVDYRLVDGLTFVAHYQSSSDCVAVVWTAEGSLVQRLPGTCDRHEIVFDQG